MLSVYYKKALPISLCITTKSVLTDIWDLGVVSLFLPSKAPILSCRVMKPAIPSCFLFNRFDASNPKPADDMMASFPKVRLMVPELVLIENEKGSFLQVNSLGPVYSGRVNRFIRHILQAKPRTHRDMLYTLSLDSFEDWQRVMDCGLEKIRTHRIEKFVPSRRIYL